MVILNLYGESPFKYEFFDHVHRIPCTVQVQDEKVTTIFKTNLKGSTCLWISQTAFWVYTSTESSWHWQLLIYLIDIDNSGYVSDYELQDLFKEASLPLPGYKVREIVEKILAVADNNKDGKISFEEFVSVSKLSNLLLATDQFASRGT